MLQNDHNATTTPIADTISAAVLGNNAFIMGMQNRQRKEKNEEKSGKEPSSFSPQHNDEVVVHTYAIQQAAPHDSTDDSTRELPVGGEKTQEECQEHEANRLQFEKNKRDKEQRKLNNINESKIIGEMVIRNGKHVANHDKSPETETDDDRSPKTETHDDRSPKTKQEDDRSHETKQEDVEAMARAALDLRDEFCPNPYYRQTGQTTTQSSKLSLKKKKIKTTLQKKR